MMSTSKQQIAIPDDFTSSQRKLVYLSLLVTEEPTVSELQELLGLSKLTLLPILSSLVEEGHAQRTEGKYVAQ